VAQVRVLKNYRIRSNKQLFDVIVGKQTKN